MKSYTCGRGFAVRSPWVMGALSALVAASSAFSWWDGGHKAIALVAYEKLSPQEQAWVMRQMEAHPTKAELFEEPMKVELGQGDIPADLRARWFFAQAAIWSDLIRNREGYPNAKEINATYHHSGWHYTDLPVFPDAQAEEKMKAQVEMPLLDWQPGMAEPEHGFNSIHTLKRVIHELGDPAVAPKDKAVNLTWLFHLVGDMHQPCHCAQLFVPGKMEDGDRGANRVLILGIKRANPELEADVLHFFWDSLWNEAENNLKDIQTRIFPLKADAALWEKAQVSAQKLDPVEWLHEGHALAVRYVYSPDLLRRLATVTPRPNPGRGRPEDVLMVSMSTLMMDAYIREARFVSRQQVVTAGVRLAEVLKAVIAKSGDL